MYQISRLARDPLTLLRTPVSVIFSMAPKLTTQLSSCCNAFWGNIYPFAMPGPPGELMTRENIFFENDIRCHLLMGMSKLFLEMEFQHNGNKQMKKCEFSAKSCGFLGRNRFREKNYLNTTQKRTKNIWTKLSSLGQEPTFNCFVTL